jgi:hypothetical protein
MRDLFQIIGSVFYQLWQAVKTKQGRQALLWVAIGTPLMFIDMACRQR